MLGLDYEGVRTSEEIRRLLTRHVESINGAHPSFRNVTKIFIPENNLGHEATHMMEMIGHRPDVLTYWQKQDRPGIRKDAGTADKYVAVVEDRMRANKIRFSDRLFTNTRNQTPAQAKARLQEEFERYHVEMKVGRSAFEKTRRVVTGKGGGDIQDDLLISTMQGIFWGNYARTAPAGCFR